MIKVHQAFILLWDIVLFTLTDYWRHFLFTPLGTNQMDGLREHLVSQIHTSEWCLELWWVFKPSCKTQFGWYSVFMKTVVEVWMLHATLNLSPSCRCDSVGDDVLWGRAVLYDASSGSSWSAGKGRASVPASNLHHWCLHGHGQVWVSSVPLLQQQ